MAEARLLYGGQGDSILYGGFSFLYGGFSFLYGGGSCSVWRRLVYCMAVRETRFCMADFRFCMAEAHDGRGFPPSSTLV